MSDLGYGTETAEPAAAPGPDAGDDSWKGEDSPAAIYGADPDAFAAEDQLPARQETRTATWDDDDLGYDEAGLSGEYDGELEALTSGDQLPSRQDSRAATWGDDPEYVSEADQGSGYDGDLDALTAGDYAVDHARGDQGQAAEPHGPPAAGSPADADATEADTGEQPQDQPADAVTRQAAQADDGRARPETALEAELKDLKAEYQASLAELKAELQSLRDHREAIPDRSGDTGRDAGQPRLNDRELPVDRQDAREAEHEHDRPGIWSNAKTQLYGGIGAVGTGLVFSRVLSQRTRSRGSRWYGSTDDRVATRAGPTRRMEEGTWQSPE